MNYPDTGVQNGCHRHPERHPVARCVECGAPLCDACINESDGKYYCERHIPTAKPLPETPAEPLAEKVKIRVIPLLAALLPAVLLLAGALLIPNDLSGLFGDYTERVTGVQFQQITGGLEGFNDDVGRYPNEDEGLRALREEPADTSGWLGPYLPEDYYENGEVVDATGQPVGYQLRDDGYMLTSSGSDGEPGTEDDIAFLGPLK